MIGSGFSKSLVAVWSEKEVSRIGFEHGNPLNFRGACPGRSPAQNRSISRNECPWYPRSVPQDWHVTLTSKCNFPGFRSAATQTPMSLGSFVGLRHALHRWLLGLVMAQA